MTSHDRHDQEPKLTGVLARVLGPAGPEVTCERCFEVLDRYVELKLAGAEADAELPGMRAHLEGCPACNEDLESLRALVAEGAGPRPHDAGRLVTGSAGDRP